MIDFSHYRDRLSDRAREIIERAVLESQRRQHYFLGVEHIFLAFTIVEGPLFEEVMAGLGIDPREVVAALKEKIKVSRQYTGGGMNVPAPTRALFQSAWGRVQSSGRQLIKSTDILVAIFLEGHYLPAQILQSMGVDPKNALERVIIEVKKREEFERESQKRFELPPFLKQFGINLNRQVSLGKVPPVIGREEEIARMIEFLCHKDRPNSVMILGESGVGKTALVQGLARTLELQPEAVPGRLRGHQIINLQMNSMVAGTMFRGMFEERIERVIREVKERDDLILFIDEAHNIVGAGSALGVPADAANILKSSLSQGEIRIIGATT
ncbi:MAG: AAA family ATPase, partial [bacterium]|nr:AAA family ATPase [bacterium]